MPDKLIEIVQYHYAQMQYSKSSPCTNVPIHCPSSTSVSKAPQTIWKYNALFHLTSEHATDSTPTPYKIPRQLLADSLHMLGGKSMIFQALKVCWNQCEQKKCKKEADQT